jgi:hypothetical protein
MMLRGATLPSPWLYADTEGAQEAGQAPPTFDLWVRWPYAGLLPSGPLLPLSAELSNRPGTLPQETPRTH